MNCERLCRDPEGRVGARARRAALGVSPVLNRRPRGQPVFRTSVRNDHASWSRLSRSSTASGAALSSAVLAASVPRQSPWRSPNKRRSRCENASVSDPLGDGSREGSGGRWSFASLPTGAAGAVVATQCLGAQTREPAPRESRHACSLPTRSPSRCANTSFLRVTDQSLVRRPPNTERLVPSSHIVIQVRRAP